MKNKNKTVIMDHGEVSVNCLGGVAIEGLESGTWYFDKSDRAYKKLKRLNGKKVRLLAVTI